MNASQTLPTFTIDVTETSLEEGVFDVIADDTEEAKEIIYDLVESGEIFDGDLDETLVTTLLDVDVHRSNITTYRNADAPLQGEKSFLEGGLPFAGAGQYPALHYPAPQNGVAVWFARYWCEHNTYAVRAADFSAAVDMLLARNGESKDDEFVTTVMASGDLFDKEDFVEVLVAKNTFVDVSYGFDLALSEGDHA